MSTLGAPRKHFGAHGRHFWNLDARLDCFRRVLACLAVFRCILAVLKCFYAPYLAGTHSRNRKARSRKDLLEQNTSQPRESTQSTQNKKAQIKLFFRPFD